MTERTETGTRPNGRASITLTPSEGQSGESVAEDFRRSEELLQDRIDRGVDQWLSHFRTFGRVRVAWTKEVGPPPWPIPKLYGKVKRGPWHFAIGIGWRSTAYTIHVAYPVPSDSSGEDTDHE